MFANQTLLTIVNKATYISWSVEYDKTTYQDDFNSIGYNLLYEDT